jgi:N-acetylglucosamine-6-phosphate deacetylase
VQAVDGDPAELERLAAFYARHGVTGFLGTIGGSRDHIETGLAGLVELRARQTRGATGALTGAACLGVHLEGPFLNPERAGAFRPRASSPRMSRPSSTTSSWRSARSC